MSFIEDIKDLGKILEDGQKAMDDRDETRQWLIEIVE